MVNIKFINLANLLSDYGKAVGEAPSNKELKQLLEEAKQLFQAAMKK